MSLDSLYLPGRRTRGRTGRGRPSVRRRGRSGTGGEGGAGGMGGGVSGGGARAVSRRGSGDVGGGSGGSGAGDVGGGIGGSGTGDVGGGSGGSGAGDVSGGGTRRGVRRGVGGSGAGGVSGGGTRRGRGTRGGRARNTPRGSSRGAGADDGLNDRERAVLKGPWQKQENVFTEYPFCGPTPGPTVTSSGESASARFERFFTDEVWTLLVTETNRYAAQCRAASTTPTQRPLHYITKEEMKAYAHGNGHLQVATSFYVLVYYLTPDLKKVMPLLRLQQIWRFLHLNNSSQQVA